MNTSCEWTALVITCKTKQCADAIQQQLELKQNRGYLSDSLSIFCIEDPQDGVGSGGATLNALLIVTEHLSMKKGYTVVTSDVLKDVKILLIHMGRHFPYDPCTRSFICLPLVSECGELEDLVTNFDSLYYILTNLLSHNSPPGLWVCSSDMLLQLPGNITIDWENLNVENGVLGISVPASIDYGGKHGVFQIDENNRVIDIIFQGTSSDISRCLTDEYHVPLATGIVFFSSYATERLLTTHVTPPLDGCTYLGSDSGTDAVCISLFFDILLAMASGVTKEEFVTGHRSGAFGQDVNNSLLSIKEKQFMQHARSVLWKHLHNLEFKVKHFEVGTHLYFDMQLSPLEYCNMLREHPTALPGFKFSNITHSYVDEDCVIGSNVMLINSIVEHGVKIGNNSTLFHCHVTENVIIGNNCYIYGLDESASRSIPNGTIPNDSMILGMTVRFSEESTKHLYVSMFSHENLLGEANSKEVVAENCTQRKSLLDNAVARSKPIPISYRNVIKTKFTDENIGSFFMARVFPIFHFNSSINIAHAMQLLKQNMSNKEYKFWFDCSHSSYCEILENVHHTAEFEHRQSIFLSVACNKIKNILLANHNTSLLPFFKTFVLKNKTEIIFDVLDSIAVKAVQQNKKEERRPDISARSLACIADVLGYMARNKAGLRSGPSANKQWKSPLSLLESGDIKNGVQELGKIRKMWLHHPDLLIRAARHYEGAEQILIRHAVLSATSFISTIPCPPLQSATWYVAECPARIDISGGWTDTPPICYEHGGSVVNAAILLNGKKPIGARIRKLDEPIIQLKLFGLHELEVKEIKCTSSDQLIDYCQPQAPGALLKACIVLADLINVKSTQTLQNQLLRKYGGGFELQTWSKLPQGSGLGTSSILAGAVLYVVFRASGQVFDTDSLIHSVLIVEQMLTTGGGWQDQVGGLIGGVKIGRSEPKLPLQVTTEVLITSDDFYHRLGNHLKLIYTGKTRLARNLLQNVLRNWYTKRLDIIKNCYDLKSNAEACAEACKKSDLEKIGHHIGLYWDQKKLMASGCEPELCVKIMKALSPYAFGQSLTGAGGGGFMFVLTKEPLSNDFVKSLLNEVEGAQDTVVYDVEIDNVGISYHTHPISLP